MLASWRDRRFSRRCRTRRRASPTFGGNCAKVKTTCSSLGDAIESTEAEIQPFIKRYWIDTADGEGPLPLSCAYEGVEAALAEAVRPPGCGS